MRSATYFFHHGTGKKTAGGVNREIESTKPTKEKKKDAKTTKLEILPATVKRPLTGKSTWRYQILGISSKCEENAASTVYWRRRGRGRRTEEG